MRDLRSAGGLLELMRQPGIGPGTALALAEHFPTVAALAASSPPQRRAVAGARGADIDVALVENAQVKANTDGVVGY